MKFCASAQLQSETMPLFTNLNNCKCVPTFDSSFEPTFIFCLWLKVQANLSSEVERKFCLMLVDKMQLRLSRMLDTVMRHARSLKVC